MFCSASSTVAIEFPSGMGAYSGGGGRAGGAVAFEVRHGVLKNENRLLMLLAYPAE